MSDFPDYKKIPTSDLIPYARNSRTHSDEHIAQIAASIKEFGFLNPIIVDGDNGIIAGHGRVLAAQKLGIDELPCIEASHLTNAQRKAYVIADNKLALNADWDNDLLKVELDELQALDFDIELTGFSLDEIADLNTEDSEPEGEVPTDAGISDSVVEICLSGDIWMLGRHRIICGDSSNPDDIETLLNGASPDLLIYDPPYEIDEAWNWAVEAPAALVFSDFKHVVQSMRVASMYENVYQFVWDCCTSWYTPNRPLARHKTAFYCSNSPYWDFDAAIYQDGKHRSAKTVTNTRGSSNYEPLDDGFVHLQTVFQEPNTQQDNTHDHAKPIKWLNALMRGAECTTILDLFAGSGATIIAAPKNSTVYAVEIDPIVCDRLIDRWYRTSGVAPILHSTGQTYEEVKCGRKKTHKAAS